MEGGCDGRCERTGYGEVAFREFDAVVNAFVRLLDHRLEKNTPGSGIMWRVPTHAICKRQPDPVSV